MTNFRWWLVFGAAAGTSLSVAGCSARYEVGQGGGAAGEAGVATGGGGSGSVGEGATAGLSPGGRSGTGGLPQQNGSGGQAGAAWSGGGLNQGGAGWAGGATGQAGAATPVGGAAGGLTACIQGAPAPVTFEPAEPTEMWRRLTTYFYSEPLPAPADLPMATSFAWIRETALRMLHGNASSQGLPPGSSPVLGQLIANWIPDRVAAFRYAEPLLADGATLSSLWWAPDPDEPHRIGLLTDPSLLSDRPSISTRGSWVLRQVFCREVPPPPSEVPPVPELPGLTRRQEATAAFSQPVCAGCHAVVDAPGFSLEHFDAMGEYRTEDDGQPIDASGVIRVENFPYQEVFSFSDIEDLAQQLPNSCFAGQCFSRNVWTDAVQRVRETASPEARPGELDTVLVKFASDQYSIDALISAVVTSPSFAESE